MKTLAEQAYLLLQQVPPGKVTTYKALATKLDTKAYRAIGQAMRHNPYAYQACPEPGRRVPCHRVIRSDGTLGGFMGKTSGQELERKKRLLRSEGVEITGNKVNNFEKILYTF